VIGPTRILVAIATYNEIENAPRLIDEIFQHLPHADILVIDDNSPDGTGKWCDERARVDGRVRCLHRPCKMGLGSAAIAGMRYAMENDYQLVLTLDADFSHHPRYLPELASAMTRGGEFVADVMIGSRYAAGGGVEGWPLRRRLLSRSVNWLARRLAGLQANDCTGALRCYRVETLKQLDLKTIRSSGYAYLEEILWRLQRQDARIGETPIVFVDRQEGRSKISACEALAVLWMIARLAVRDWLSRASLTLQKKGHKILRLRHESPRSRSQAEQTFTIEESDDVGQRRRPD
jgi:dolichol-phosphate mannosyltransferase